MFLTIVDEHIANSLPKSILDNAAELEKSDWLKIGKDNNNIWKLLKKLRNSSWRTFLPNWLEFICERLITLVMNIFNLLDKIIFSYFVCFLLIIYQAARLSI